MCASQIETELNMHFKSRFKPDSYIIHVLPQQVASLAVNIAGQCITLDLQNT
jgi:hypothetical protein